MFCNRVDVACPARPNAPRLAIFAAPYVIFAVVVVAPATLFAGEVTLRTELLIMLVMLVAPDATPPAKAAAIPGTSFIPCTAITATMRNETQP